MTKGWTEYEAFECKSESNASERLSSYGVNGWKLIPETYRIKSVVIDVGSGVQREETSIHFIMFREHDA